MNLRRGVTARAAYVRGARLSTVLIDGDVHGRIASTPLGPMTFCGLYGDPEGGVYDLRDAGAMDRITCPGCRPEGDGRLR